MARPETLKAGDIISGSYRVLAKIGEGGMGSVYKVEHLSMHRVCALKTFAPEGSAEGAEKQNMLWQRLQQEAQTISKLAHKSIIHVYDFGRTTSGTAYYVMDFVQGRTLTELVRQQGQLNMRQALAVFVQVAEGLAYAHSRKLVHRDIKPSNIMLEDGAGKDASAHAGSATDSPPSVKIVDFGLAQTRGQKGEAPPGGFRAPVATNEMLIEGSPPYMSPEQFLNGVIDKRSDIYSFGCTLFEALTGVPPFIGDSSLVLSMKHINDAPPTLAQASLGKTFPVELEMIAARLLAKNPDERYQDMSVVAEDLQGVLDSSPQTNESFMRSAARSGENGSSDRPRRPPIAPPPQSLSDSQNTTVTQLPPSNLPKLIVIGAAVLILAGGTALTLSLLSPNKKPQAQPMNSAPVSKKEVPATTSATANTTATNTSDTPLATIKGDVPDPAKEPFSHLETDSHGNKVLVFNFPEDVMLGRLVDRNTNNKIGRIAKGKIVFPAGHLLQFLPSSQCCGSPSYFRRFRPDDLFELDVTKDDSVTSEMLNYIDHMTGLQRLNLIDTEINNDCIAALDQLPKLTHLDVSNTNITGEALAKLKSLPRLESLRMSQVSGIGPVLTALKNSPNLRDLHVDSTSATKTDLEKIAAFKKLHVLSLNHTRLDLPGLEILSHNPALFEISVLSDGLEANCVPTLKKFKKLRILKISCDTWKPAQIEDLRKALPGVQLDIAEKFDP